MSKVRIGLVGAGRWAAQHHLPGLAAHPDAALAAVYDPDAARSGEVVRRFGGVVATGVEELVDAVDAVVVASPPAAHHAAASFALDRGRPVLVEKPMTIEAREAWDLVDRADRAGVPLMVGYTFELAPSADRVVEAVAELGELVVVDGVYASAMRHLFEGPWASVSSNPLAVPQRETFADPAVSGGGQARGQLTHLLAAALRAAALEPRSATALFRPEGAAVELHVALTVDLGPAVATFASTCLLPSGQPPHWELRYIGEGGTVVHDLATGAAVVRFVGRHELRIPALEPDDRYPSEAVVQRFVDVALGRAENPVPGRLGAEVAAVLEAAHRSAGRGGEPSTVPRPDRATRRQR